MRTESVVPTINPSNIAELMAALTRGFSIPFFSAAIKRGKPDINPRPATVAIRLISNVLQLSQWSLQHIILNSLYRDFFMNKQTPPDLFLTFSQ